MPFAAKEHNGPQEHPQTPARLRCLRVSSYSTGVTGHRRLWAPSAPPAAPERPLAAPLARPRPHAPGCGARSPHTARGDRVDCLPGAGHEETAAARSCLPSCSCRRPALPPRGEPRAAPPRAGQGGTSTQRRAEGRRVQGLSRGAQPKPLMTAGASSESCSQNKIGC